MFFNKLCQVELLQKCRGNASHKAENIQKQEQLEQKSTESVSTGAAKNKKTTPILIVAVLAAVIIGGFFIIRSLNGSRRSVQTEPPEQTASVSPPAKQETPGVEEATEKTEATGTLTEETESENSPETIDEETQDAEDSSSESIEESQENEEKKLVYGEWTYGSVLISETGDCTLHVEFKDNRIPYGYPMSETPGNNAANWDVHIHFGLSDLLLLSWYGNEKTASFNDLQRDFSQTIKGEFTYLYKPSFELKDNTFYFDLTIPDSFPFQLEDIQIVYVNLGTQAINYSDHYEFYPLSN